MPDLLFYKRGLSGARSRWLRISNSRRGGGGCTVYATGDGNLPSWAPTPAVFWGAADRYEKSTIRYRELVALLPRKLSHETCIALVRGFCRRLFGGSHMASWAIQESPSRTHDWAENPRVHIMFCDRTIDPDGPEPPKSHYFSAVPRKDGLPAGWPKSPEFRGASLKDWLRRAAADWAHACGEALLASGFPGDPLAEAVRIEDRLPPVLRRMDRVRPHVSERRSSYCHR